MLPAPVHAETKSVVFHVAFVAAIAASCATTTGNVAGSSSSRSSARTSSTAVAAVEPPRVEVEREAPADVSACEWVATLHPAAPPTESKQRDEKRADDELQRGVKLSESGEHEAAKQAFESAITADPQNGNAYLAAAENHLYTDDNREAMRAMLDRAIALMPQNPRVHLRYGDYFAEIGKKVNARSEWRCAIELRDDLADAHLRLGRLHFDGGDLEQAEKELRRAAAAAAKDIQAHVFLADVLEAQKKLSEAAGELLTAAKLGSRAAPLYRRAASLYEAAGDVMSAKKARQKADSLDPPKKARNLRPLPIDKRRRPDP
jgi:Tfp pilus assembly protein PilF